jgi:hypothetical protein
MIHTSAAQTTLENKMSKAQMINAIMETANIAAISAGKTFDRGDMFFTLAFRTNRELKALCKKLGV